MSGRELAIGVDVGGTLLKLALCTRDGEVLRSIRTETLAYQGYEAVMQRIASLTRELIGDAKVPAEEIRGVGVGLAGRIDMQTGVAVMCPNLPEFLQVPVARPLEAALKLPVRVANDAGCAALGEVHFGAAKGSSDVVLLTLGTGVGGAVVRDGRLDRGSRGVLGEIGHAVIDVNGPECSCGQHGCLEAFAGRRAIEGRARRMIQTGRATTLLERAGGDILAISPRIIAEAAEGHDAVACEVLAETALYLGAGIVNAIVLCDPDAIVLGGGIAEAGEALLAPLRRVVESRCRIGQFRGDRIIPARLGSGAGMIGAACLVLTPEVGVSPR